MNFLEKQKIVRELKEYSVNDYLNLYNEREKGKESFYSSHCFPK